MACERKNWFKVYKGFIKLFKKPTNFKYVGEKITVPSVILSNHVGTSAPLSFELYLENVPMRFWGANEMNSGLKNMYKYQTEVFYHEKRGWNIHLARIYCLLASPLTNIFYKGLNLISTYKDGRFVKTIKESFDAIQDGNSLVIFPEVSDKGYLDVLEDFHKGFVIMLDYAYKKGVDLPVVVTYYHKKSNVHLIDEKIMYSELINKFSTYDEIANYLCDRCNKLGDMCQKSYIEELNSKNK